MRCTLLRTFLGCSLMMACMMAAFAPAALADAKYAPINPENPYGAPVSGLFHDQKIDANGVKGQYGIHIPEGLQPWSPALMLLTPAKTSARDFIAGPIGRRWIAAADSIGFAVAFIEPENAGEWNLAAAPGGRDEAEMIRQVYMTLRSKSRKVDAAFTMDKSNVALIGYAEGGAAAHLIASKRSTIFSGLVSVDAAEAPLAALKENGDSYCYPWPADNWNGMDEVRLPNRNVALPVWLIRTNVDAPENAEALQYWLGVDNAKPAGENRYAALHATDNPALNIWTTGPDKAGAVTEEIIWNRFLGRTKRFLGFAGGEIAASTQFIRDAEGAGFTVREEMLNGFKRRWMTYVPVGRRDAAGKMPLVVVLHGYSASMYALAEESRWFDLADRHGFLVVYGQGYPNERSNSGNIAIPAWNEFAAPVDAGGTDDVAYLRHIIAETKRNYPVDTERVYMTGHSNGSNMTWRMAIEAPELFAAVAPVGHTQGARKDGYDTRLLLPVWAFKGEYDLDGADKIASDNNNGLALRFWNRRNGADETRMLLEKDETGRYVSRTFPGDGGAPLVKFTGVSETPHAYLPDEARMIWEEFFSRYSRDANGVLRYGGVPVARREYAEDGAWLSGGRDALSKAGALPIWEGTAPGSEGVSIVEREIERSTDPRVKNRAYTGITRPSITPFPAAKPNGTAVLLMTGGAYERVTWEKEGVDLARILNDNGVTVFILKYRLPAEGHANRQWVPLQDAQRAIRTIRANARNWGLDPGRIGALGYSAGGNLAATLGVLYNHPAYEARDAIDGESARPDFLALIYPVISMDPAITHAGSSENLLGKVATAEMLKQMSADENVTAETPPTFLVHAHDDDLVSPENSIRMYRALHRAKVPAELLLFGKGGHGFGVKGVRGLPAEKWPALFLDWLNDLK